MLVHEREINERVRFEPRGEDRYRQYAEIFLDDVSIGYERVLLPGKPFDFDEAAGRLVPRAPVYQYYTAERWHYAAPPALNAFPPYDSIVREDECNNPETGEVVTGWHGAYNSVDRLLYYAKDIQVVPACQFGDVIVTANGEGRFLHYELYPPLVQPPDHGTNSPKYFRFDELPETFRPGERIRLGVTDLPKTPGGPDPAYFEPHLVTNQTGLERLVETVSVDVPE